jgi:predicted nucleic acid-binding protein
MLFFDTSALVKRYADEQGTQTVDRLIETPENTIVITSLSVIEIASAFRRKYNRGEISEQKRDGLLVSFFVRVYPPQWHSQVLNRSISDIKIIVN